MANYGANFMPRARAGGAMSPNSGGGASPLQRAVKILSLRLPKRPMAPGPGGGAGGGPFSLGPTATPPPLGALPDPALPPGPPPGAVSPPPNIAPPPMGGDTVNIPEIFKPPPPMGGDMLSDPTRVQAPHKPLPMSPMARPPMPAPMPNPGGAPLPPSPMSAPVMGGDMLRSGPRGPHKPLDPNMVQQLLALLQGQR